MALPTDINPFVQFAGGAAGDLGDPIQQSLRFNGAQKLSRSTVDTTTGSTSGTFSVWYKRAYKEDTSIRTIFNASSDGGSQLNPSTNSVNFRVPSHSTAFSSLGGQLRDQSAWYHVVTSYDSSNTNLWINGELFGTSATQADNVLRLNASCFIGTAGTVQWFEGYLAHFIVVEGQALTPTSFGRTNDDGVWVPQNYTGTYGTNGFKLTFDSSQANGIGHDSSGNGNHFTASNFDTADINLYSSQVFTTGYSTQDFTSTRQNFNGSQPPTGSFDGNGSTAGQSAGGDDDSTYFVRFTTPIQNVTSIEMKPTNGSGSQYHYINGTQGTFSSGGVKQTIYSGTAITLETVGVNWISSNAGSGFYQLWVNGTELIDNTDNDVDYNDTPTNNFATQNPLIKSPTTLVHSEANLKNVDSNGAFPNVDPGTQILKGKKYWEIEYVIENGYPYVGVSPAADIQNGGSWYATNTAYFKSNGGFTGMTDNSTNFSANNGDILSLAYDSDTKQIQFRLNNGTADTRTVNVGGADDDFVPVILNALSNEIRVNYGQRPFIYTPPTGYTALATNNESEPAIKDPRKHFDIITWTGDAVDDRDIAGLEFAPDLVWIKQTNGTQHHGLYDTLRGATIRQTTSTNQADSTQADALQAFNSDGFQIGTDGQVNGSGHSYKAWCWKAGGAPTATNTAGVGNVPTAGSVKIDGTDLTTALPGTIAAEKLSANTTAGFSIVTYTGTGSNGTIAHGLTQAPEMVQYKITSSTNGWCSYSFRDASKYMQWNQSGAETSSGTVFNSTDPTNSVLNVGTNVLTNGNTSSYLAYCWHSVPGFSKIGQHRGNGHADGNVIYTDFKPQFLILKSTTTTQNWVWYDTTGQVFNPADRYQYVNLTNAEASSSTTEIDFLANGFKFRDTHAMLNASGVYFLYMAFAQNPFGGENTAPATAR